MVGRFHVAAEIGAVDFDRAGHGLVWLLGGEGFAELVGEDERRLVLDVQVAAELEALWPLAPFTKMAMARRIVADRQLAAGEDGPGRDAELMLTRLALEHGRDL